MAKKRKLVVLDLLGQKVKEGNRAIYLKSTINGDIPIRSVVKEVRIRERTEKDAKVCGFVPIIQVTLDCGKLWGIIKARDPNKLVVVDKLGLSKWKLEAII